MGGRRQVRAVGRTRGGRGLARNPRNRGGLPPGRVDALAGWRSKDGDGNRRAGTHCLSSGTATPMLKRPLVRPADRCAARSERPTAGDFLLTLGASARICFLHFLCITRQISGDTGPPVSIFLSLYLAGDPSRVADPFFTSPFLTEAPAPFFPFFSRSGSRSFPGAEKVFLFLPATAATAASIEEPW